MYLMRYYPEFHHYLVRSSIEILYANSGQRSLAYLSISKVQSCRFSGLKPLQYQLKELLVPIKHEYPKTEKQPNLRVCRFPLSPTNCRTPSRSQPKFFFNSLSPKKIQFKKKKNLSRQFAIYGLILSLSFFLYCNAEEYIENQLDKSIFNPPRFTPFEIINREDISSSSFILTVRSSQNLPSHLHDDPYKQYWEKGIWSVQAKQPELQIARSYTPLPPRLGDPNDYLRFLIRKKYNGEMSTYLHGLKIGSIMHLRGPYQELEIPQDLGQVLFFAGGTGIAPALQIAHELLERKTTKGARDVSIHIFWANQRREDCNDGGRDTRILDNCSPSTPQTKECLNSLMSDLERLQQNYSKQFTIQYFVDEENTTITPKFISKLLHEVVDRDIYKSRLNSTSSLLLVSGPEGFIEFIAGPKEWVDGKHAQGRVDGVLKNFDLRNWQVWKL